MYELWTDVDLVSELCAIEEGLREWEVEFVDSISKWLDVHDGLTEKQRGKAQELAEKYL